MEEAQEHAIAEFRRCAGLYVSNPCTGTRYALEMAAVECQMLGIDPSEIRPTPSKEGE